MLNIDIADVKRIAKGIGLALTFEDDDQERLVARLPRESMIARSALLHFKCADDVSLKEIYSISKSITVKNGINAEDPRITSHMGAKKLIRRINVKLGIRVIKNQICNEFTVKRINLVAILFGF